MGGNRRQIPGASQFYNDFTGNELFTAINRLRHTVRVVNLISDLVETFPASKPALLAIDRDGGRRVWHFGVLIAMSASWSGVGSGTTAQSAKEKTF